VEGIVGGGWVGRVWVDGSDLRRSGVRYRESDSTWLHDERAIGSDRSEDGRTGVLGVFVPVPSSRACHAHSLSMSVVSVVRATDIY
jgi:hypothetical protein